MHYRFIAMFVFFLTFVVPGFAADRKWNVLLVTADDMNADSAGWMGQKLGATPNLDALAATCHRFVNNHVSAPICQPSREAFMTGRVPHRNGGLGFNPIREDVTTLVEVLKENGYYTVALNKVVHMAPRSKFPWDKTFNGSGKNPEKFRSEMDESLREAMASGKPFFINANITDPHRPFYNREQGKARAAKTNRKNTTAEDAENAAESEGRIETFSASQVTTPDFLEDIPPVREEVAQYYSSIRRFDATFGQIIAALKSSGQESQTVILFMSDHGMSFPFSKATCYRNGTWSPVILRWPGMGGPQVHEEFTSSVDLMPTLLELLSIKAPEGLDGRSWMPLLRGETQPDRDFVVTHVNTVSSGKSFPQRCIRTKNHSLMFHAWVDGKTQFKVEAMNGITFQALAVAGKTDTRIQSRVDQLVRGTPLAFYDLRSDPNERNNCIDQPVNRAEVDRLTKLLLTHMEKTQDPQLENFRKLVTK